MLHNGIPFTHTLEHTKAAQHSVHWTVALVVSHLFLSRPLPVDLLAQWRWFVEGRWPCAYAPRTEEEADRFLQLYSEGFPSKGLVAQMEETPNEFVVF